MKIVVDENSPERLALLLRPVTRWGYWLAGLVFFILGAFVAWTLGRGVELNCARFSPREGTCIFRETRGFGWNRSEIPLGDVQAARVDTVDTALSSSMRLVVRTRGGPLPIPLVRADGNRKIALAVALSQFLDQASIESFSLKEDTRLLGWGFAALLFAAGIVCIVALETIRIIAVRETGTIRIEQTRWRHTRTREVAIARVRHVEKRCYSVRYTLSCNVVLVMATGAPVAVARMPLFTNASAGELVHVLDNFVKES